MGRAKGRMRGVGVIAFAGGMVIGAVAAWGQSGALFTAAKVSVSAEAKDAVQAKELALAQGQRKALRMIMKRLTDFRLHSRLPVLEDGQVERMIDGFAVRREQNSATQYLATLDFNFEPHAVKEILNQFGIPYTEERSAPTLLLPVMVEAGALKSSQNNAWYGALAALDHDNALTPIKLAAPRADFTPDMLERMSGRAGDMLETLRYQYRADSIVLAAAEIDPGATQLRLRLIGQDPTGALALERRFKIYGKNTDETAALAAQVALGVIEGRWKMTRLASQGALDGPAELQSVALTAQFAGLREWQQIRARLESIPGLQGLNVKALHARGAQLAMEFPGGVERLAQAVQSQGLVVGSRDGEWVLEAR